jgi:hypothetical protein
MVIRHVRSIVVKTAGLAVILLLALVLQVQLVAPRQTLGATRADGSFSAITRHDAYVLSTDPQSAYGMESLLGVCRHTNSSFAEEAAVFIQFDLAGLGQDVGVVGAWMSVYKKWGWPDTGNLRAGAYSCGSNSWEEETITWDNAPWATTSTEPLDTSYIDTYGTFDVTSAVQQALPSGKLTIVLRAEEGGEKYLESNTAALRVGYITAESVKTIMVDGEYRSGFVPDSPLWYTWIDTGLTRLVFFVAANPESNQCYPLVSFVGQHFYARDGTELVVGHAVLVYELFNDTNRNGILDADFRNGSGETAYYLALNMSTGFVSTPVHKVHSSETTRYRWGVRYTQVMGFLLYTNGSAAIGGDSAALIELEFLETGYEYYLLGNESYLKTSLSLGAVSNFTAIGPAARLEGYGLSALHSTLLLSSSKASRFLVESEEYNSTHSEEPTLPMTTASMTNDETRFYNLLFGENYTLGTLPPESHTAPTSACPSTSLDHHVPKKHFGLPLNVFQGVLSALLPQITESPLTVDLDYRHSGLLYRVSYPIWNGCALVHDLTYVAYLGERPTYPREPSMWIVIAVVVGVFGSVALILSISNQRKLRNIQRT